MPAADKIGIIKSGTIKRMARNTFSLSKSQYLKGIQCLKAIWLFKHRPEIATPHDDIKLSVFAEGINVGKLARNIFPNGKLIELENRNFGLALWQTKNYLESLNTSSIFEAAFSSNGLFVMCDILNKTNFGWDIYEVKASTNAKQVHIEDIAMQYHVLSSKNITINKTYIVHINNNYILEDILDVNKLFNAVDVTEQVIELQPEVAPRIEKIRATLKGSMPNIKIGPQCSRPYDCEFRKHCWQHVPDYSVFNLTRLAADKKFDLANQGIMKIEDIPNDFVLNTKQQIQVDCERNDESVINKEELKLFLENIKYPVYFLDFESYQQAIPNILQTKPYQQIPFQFSLHIKKSHDSKLEHREFLANPNEDPRRPLAKKLIEYIPDNATIVVYNSSFEKQIINSLANLFPEYQKRLQTMSSNIIDLLLPFQQNFFYTKEMRGSNSLKSVLPAIVPTLSYTDLEVSNGGQAGRKFLNLRNCNSQEEKSKTRKALLEYCKLDTLAMFELLEKLKEVIKL
jgi:hypothetical protein